MCVNRRHAGDALRDRRRDFRRVDVVDARLAAAAAASRARAARATRRTTNRAAALLASVRAEAQVVRRRAIGDDAVRDAVVSEFILSPRARRRRTDLRAAVFAS